MQISHDYFANLVTDFLTTFVRVSHECRVNFHVSQTSHELVAKVFNMYNHFRRIFSPKYLARLSPRKFGESTMQNFHDTHTNVVRQSGNSLEKT